MYQNDGFGELKANACHLLDYLLCLSHRDVEQGKYGNLCSDLEFKVFCK